jgi:hypothetical protein
MPSLASWGDNQMLDPTPHPWRVLLALDGRCETLELLARDRARALASALELTELGRGAAVVRCQRLGEW